MLHIDQHPPSKSIAGEALLRWDRLWCPLGGTIELDRSFFEERPRGFLAEPSKFTNTHCRQLSEWITGESGFWVLCGAPGTGKSAAIRLWLDSIIKSEPETLMVAWTAASFGRRDDFERLLEHQSVRDTQATLRKLLIVIDAFDQFRTEGGPPFESLAASLSGLPPEWLGRIRFIIGCRSGDWDEVKASPLLAMWPVPEGGKRVLEICPLTRAQTVQAAEARQLIPEAFLEAIISQRIEASAHWPFTLRSLLDTFEADGSLSGSMMQRLSRSIDLLLHDESAPVAALDPAQAVMLRQCARRLATLLLFTGNHTVSRVTSVSKGSLSAAEFLGPTELAKERADDNTATPVNGVMLQRLCGSALMTAAKPPSVGEPQPAMCFTHQSYAEFLAAEYIARLDVNQLRSLLTLDTPAGRRVPPQLVEVAAWLAAMREDWFDSLLHDCPEILLRSDGGQFTADQKVRLLRALIQSVESWDASAFTEVKSLTPAFAFSGLPELLIPIIREQDGHRFARRLAIQIADECHLSETEDAMWGILERPGDNEDRSWAIDALHGVIPKNAMPPTTIARLRLAVVGGMGPDQNDELRGLGLVMLVPAVMPPRDAVSALRIPQQPHWHGAYRSFINGVLPSVISLEDLEAFLELGAATPSIFHAEFTAERTAAKVLRFFATVEQPTPAMRQSFAGWVLRCAKRRAKLPLTEPLYGDETQTPQVAERTRLRWLEMVIREALPSKSEIYGILHALMLSRASLAWALEKLMQAKVEERLAWAEVVSFSIADSAQREECLPLLLSAYNQISELKDALIPCEAGLNIHESYEARAEEWRKQEALYARRERKKQRKTITRREWLDKWFEEWRQGHDLAWLNLWKGCALDETGGQYDWAGGELVKSWKGWQALSASEQDMARECARAFLIARDDPHRKAQEWKPTGWSEAAHYSVGLLADALPSDASLIEAISEKWIRAWFGHYLNPNPDNERIVAVLYQINADACLEALRANFECVKKADQSSRTLQLFKQCRDARLSAALCEWLMSADMSPTTLRTSIEFLSGYDSGAAVRVSSWWMDRLEGGDCVESGALRDSILFAVLFLSAGSLFDRVIPFLSESATARRVICSGNWTFGESAGGLAATLAALSTSRLARLAALAAHAFPEDENLEEGDADELHIPAADDDEAEERRAIPNSRTVTPAMEARRVSSALLVHYAAIASGDEARAFRELLPESRRDEWSFVRSRAVRQKAQSGWQPLAATELLRMVQTPHACFVRTNDDLLQFVMTRLRAFAAQSWPVGLRPLWNEPHGQPPTAKEEVELSNRLKLWLDADRHLIVNREVQPVELMEKRLDLKIEIPGEQPLCVIVEVKKAENRDVETSMQSQLVDSYLVTGRQSHGIYAVAWFGDKPSALHGVTFEEKQERLSSLKAALAKPATVRVEYLLLDFRHPNHQPKSPKTRTKKQGGKRQSK